MLKKISGVLVGVSSMAATGAAMAQEATPFNTAMSAATSNVSTYGAALVGLAAAGVGFGIAIKYVKKIRGAA